MGSHPACSCSNCALEQDKQLSTLLPLPPWAENLQPWAQRREGMDGAPCTHTDLDSLLANCMATMHLASSTILCFLVRSESRHKPGLCVFLGGCSFLPWRKMTHNAFLSLSQKKNKQLVPFVTVCVLIPVSIFSNVPLMNGKGTMWSGYLVSSSQK